MADAVTRRLLACGLAAGPLYMAVGIAQAMTREGFDMRRHALSLLSNGDLGWIQIANFMASGALVIAGAVGVRRRLHGERGGTWGPILLGLFGIGLIGSGVFVADPGAGFPPGTATPASMTSSGLLHFVFGGLGFYALIAAGFVFARRFWSRCERGWAVYSAGTSTGFFAAFAVIASGSTSSATIVSFYVAVAWIWVWHATISARLMKGGQPPRRAPASDRSARQSAAAQHGLNAVEMEVRKEQPPTAEEYGHSGWLRPAP